MLVTSIAVGGCAEDPYAIRIPSGFVGDVFHRADCEPATAHGSIALDDRGRVRAVHVGRGELQCRPGSRLNDIELEVRDATRIELDVLGSPRAGVPWYVRTRMLDAAGHVLAADDRPDQLVWSATNAEIHSGTCASASSPSCVDEPSAATFVASAPTATIRVRASNLTAELTVRVLAP
jgi:hypothetical protein